MSTLHTAIYRVNSIPVKTSMEFFPKRGKTIPNFFWNHKPPKAKSNLEKEQSCIRKNMLPNLKLYYKGVVIKTVPYWHKTNTQTSGK